MEVSKTMAKKIGVIAEDLSDIGVVSEILKKYMKESDFAIKKFVGNGCGKIRNKCASWADMLTKMGCEHILLFHDLDRRNEADLRRELSDKIAASRAISSIVVIPIQEMEAWLLSDSNAIQRVFRLDKRPDPVAECELIESPKEFIEKTVWKLGRKRYLNTTHNQKIAHEATVNQLKRCPSYLPLDLYIREKVCP